MKTINTVFYSWQSDLPKESNLNTIRQSLRTAANNIESDLVDLRIELDEATRNTTGSPNIPQTIFDKIGKSDVFISDLTTINNHAVTTDRRVPNPNVLIELGFAIATLGWERIILVFNTFHGTFPNDLPYDIDRHRAIPFSISDKNDNNGKGNLTKILTTAVKAIIESAPLKPHEKLGETTEQKKRKIDIANLKWALSAIHIPTFDSFLEEIPDRIIGRIFYFKDHFNAVLESNTFHIYNDELRNSIENFKNSWNKSLSFYQHYGPDGSGKNYGINPF